VEVAYDRGLRNLMGTRMYRIEISPGEETAFRSIEELAVAIRRGIVSSHSRIWHNASNKWLPIQFHPHFKLASAMQLTQADLVAGPPVKPLELLTLGDMVDAPAPPRPAPEPVRTKEPARVKEPVRAKEREHRTPPDEPQPRKKRSPKTPRGPKNGRPLRVAMIGALLIGGAHLAITAAAARSKDVAIESITNRRLIAAPVDETQDRPETTAAGVLPIPRVGSADPRFQPGALPPREAVVDEGENPEGHYTAGQPAPEPEPHSASLSADLPMTAAPEIQAAPSAAEMAMPAPLATDSLTAKLVDSTGKKTMKGILKAIGGPVPSEPKPAKH
jgi:hypothetical protein